MIHRHSLNFFVAPLTTLLALGWLSVAAPPAAAREGPLSQDISGIVSRLQSNDPRTREVAEQELQRRAHDEHLTVDEGIELLRRAATFPVGGNTDRGDPAVALIRAAGERADELYMPMIRQMFAKLSPAAKFEALELLVRIRSAPAAKLYVQLVHDYPHSVPELPIETLRRQPEFGDVYFPALLVSAAETSHLGESVYLLALDYSKAGKLDPKSLATADKSIVAAYLRRHQRIAPQQQPAGVQWMWARVYQLDREPAGVLLDLLGYLPAASAEPTLRKALALSDPRLKLFAALSLIRLEKNVPYSDLETIAASSETRALLFGHLQTLNRLDLFPEKHAKQESLAESCMVQWLVYPTELGRVPDEIELMDTIPAADAARGDYFVFRFRTDDPGKPKEWLAAIAGPFKQGPPTIHDDGDTFSNFEKWEGATPQQHLAKILDGLRRMREKAQGK